MIRYQADDCTGRYIVSIEGHSNAAPRGQDIICAAASALAFTLLAAVRRLDEEGEISYFSHSVDNGSVQLDFTVKDDCVSRAETLVETITDGFLMLEENYPDYVSVC